ncbi:Gfo/Idh/MocA family protein [Nesterenkonia sphaerica]|uniref:Gfo/Idh/MocA family oxidoreductase n=1 Tax=Nesterenkonia sphaerica TaxID=1804988 RepID=A0A5R9AMK3_9MICC|nr:Gfo/Idh/MocA family oxidoreductase [Nesterenkonia sphaerica]TLP80010.1 Gfo/Idh/MocA family oxidoreductase [Nesterenkonia sphaerica]
MTQHRLGIAVIGAGMAGAAHAAAWRAATTVRRPFDHADVRLVAIADLYEPLATQVAGRYGYERVETDWRRLLAADDVHVVSVVVANHLHREIVEELINAGKHVLCEKPLSDSLGDAQVMAEAARSADTVVRIGFTFRRAPGLAALGQLVTDGTLGEVFHLSGRYYADYACSPQAPMTWRFRGAPGSGALADVGSHLLYAAEYLAGPICSVAGAKFRTAITHRPLPVGSTVGHGLTEVSSETEPVTNDDWAGFTAEFAHGAGTLEASRVTPGHPNGLRVEIACRNGSAIWDQETPAEIQLHLPDNRLPRYNGFRTVKLGPGQPYVAEGFPLSAPGIGFGQNDGFVFQARAFLEEVVGLAEQDSWARNASFDEGLRNMEIIEAVTASAAAGGVAVEVN